MIPRRLRLSRASFPQAQRGVRSTSPSFSATFGPSVAGGCSAVVSKTVARRAVARHLLKRRMLAVMRPWCKKDHFLVVYARSGATTLSFRALQVELNELLTRLVR